ncbi:MAG: DNA internalization-related competence protein ComEC/Rec2 [Tissierellia bacterium]|nr:DNA internalization-related competence protein ComEC/Rec2 [Tissierellia bacterium]
MDKPFTPMVFSIMGGILLSYYFELDNFLIFSFLALIIIFYTYGILRNKSNYVAIILMFFFLGILITNINKENTLEIYRNKRHEFTGIVHDIISSNDEYSKYAVIIESVDKKDKKEKILLTIIGDKDVSLGDRISFYGELKQPNRNTNPMLFNYRLSLLSDRIHNTMSVKDYSVNIIAENDNGFYNLKDKFNKDVKDLFDSYLNDENSKLISSIVLGDSSYLEEEDIEKYRDLGLAHILAVSGLHIGIISGFIIFVMSRLAINRKANIIISLGVLWFYCYLIGFPPSTIRASLMFTIIFYSQLVHEPYDSINTIMFSILISLFINPFYLFHIGFQLSYLATLSIVIITPRIREIFYPFKGKIVGTISAILAVNIGLLPIQSYYFNTISVIGLIANLITVPLLSLSLILAILMIFFNYTFSIINSLLGHFLNSLLDFQWIIVDFLADVSFNTFKIGSPNLLLVLVYYLAIAIIFRIIDLKNIKALNKIILYYLVGLVLLNSIYLNKDNGIEIDFIDVGQGDSILIKSQGYNYLMDTGGSIFSNNDVGKYITLPYLEKHGIFDLEAVIITHFDEDHSQGLNALLGEINISTIYASSLPIGNELINNIKEYDIPIKVLAKGDTIYLDNNTKLNIIWPDRDRKSNQYNQNNLSLVSLLSYKNHEVLFTGDIEKEVEYIINNSIISDVEILKVSHHGSNTSSTEVFLANTMPKYSIISVGRDNFYGHPNNEVLSRLNDIDSITYRTDEMGMIRLLLDDDSLKITPYLKGKNEARKLTGFVWENYYMILLYITYYLVSYLLIKIFLIIRKEGADYEIRRIY